MAARVALALLSAAALVGIPAAAALGAFGASVQTSGSAFDAYTVPTPANLRCTGLTSLTTSRLAWDAVTPPPGGSVAYLVTTPAARQTTTTATTYDLPTVTLPGQYSVLTQISSGWQSPATTITVTLTAFGLLYLCRTP